MGYISEYCHNKNINECHLSHSDRWPYIYIYIHKYIYIYIYIYIYTVYILCVYIYTEYTVYILCIYIYVKPAVVVLWLCSSVEVEIAPHRPGSDDLRRVGEEPVRRQSRWVCRWFSPSLLPHTDSSPPHTHTLTAHPPELLHMHA